MLQAVPDCVPGGGSGHVHHRHPRGDDAPRHQEEVRGQLQEREGENIHRGEQYSNTYTVLYKDRILRTVYVYVTLL